MLIETLNKLGELAFRFAWPMLWQSSLLIAVLLALDFALRRKVRAAVRYALWLVVLVKLVLPPSLALPTGLAWWLRPSSAPAVSPTPKQFVVSYTDEPLPGDSYVPAVTAPVRPYIPRLSLTAVALIVSGGITVVLLGFLIWRWGQVARQIRKSEEPPEELSEYIIRVMREAGVRRQVRLRLTSASMSPAVCGLIRPCVLLPQALVETLSTAKLRAVLLHELMHVRRMDVWVNCAQTLLQIAYWWHPLLWLANARIRWLREEAVDDGVMMMLREDADVYAPTLLEVAKLAFHRPLASLGLVGILESKRALSRRIKRLLDFQPPRRSGLSLISVLGVAAFTCLAVPQGEAPSKPARPPAAVASPTERIESRETEQYISAKYGDRASLIKTLEEQGYTYEKFRERIRAEFSNDIRPVLTADASVRPRTVAEARAENPQGRLTADSGSSITQETKDKGAGLMREAAELFRVHKLDEAAAKINEALKLDPNNQQAHYYRNLVDEAKYISAQKTGDSGFGAASTNQLRRAIVTNPKRRATFDRLTHTRIGAVAFDSDSPLNLVLAVLTDQVKRSGDTELQQIKFLVSTNAPGEGQDIGAVKIRISGGLNDIVLYEILNAIASHAEKPIKFSIEDDAIVFSPGAGNAPELTMRTFRISPTNFVPNLEHAVGAAAGSLVSSNVWRALRSYFHSRGVDLDPPKNIFWSDTRGTLLVRATMTELDTIEMEMQALSVPPETRGDGLSTRAFKLDPNTFVRRLESAAGVALGTFAQTNSASSPLANTTGQGADSGRTVTRVASPDDQKISDTVKRWFGASGVDLNPPKNLFWNGRQGTLLVRATKEDLDKIEGELAKLSTAPPQVTIRAKFVAIPQKASAGFWKSLGATNSPTCPIGSILTSTQAVAVLNRLKSQNGVDLLSELSVTTLCGRQTQARVVNSQTVVTGVTNGASEPNLLTEEVQSGPILELQPNLVPGTDEIELRTVVTVTEFLGYDDPGKQKVEVLVGEKPTRVKPPLPHFRIRNIVTNVSVLDGQTLVLGKPQITETVNNKAAKPVARKEAERKDVVVFITPRLIDAAGNPVRK